MSVLTKKASKVVIACGGTGGHFFPGLAVGQELVSRGNQVMLIASRKDVDRENAKGLDGYRIEFLPAVALLRGRLLAFTWGMLRALTLCFKWFFGWRPDVVLVMGGFTSVAPAIVGRIMGARIYLHESNSIPGRANRLIAKWCHGIFVGFPSTEAFFPGRKVTVAGTPVRSQFSERLSLSSFERFGLEPDAPVLLVMGGSQGATGINQLMLEVVPILCESHPELQCIHLAGRNECESLEEMYRSHCGRFYLSEFCSDTSVLVRMASAVLSRAGASSLAEYAAAGLPSLLVPYPAAVDDHQKHNALIFGQDGAALMVDEKEAIPALVAASLEQMIFDRSVHSNMEKSLERWDPAHAAQRIADDLLELSSTLASDESFERGSESRLDLGSNQSSNSEKVDVRHVAVS
jgi:UDP-N-acetylglucosamine--N-acetylmuramyl-(pentapeptide) pyrophosphoryl-undecaprenol N-acetylglucosamine transferase